MEITKEETRGKHRTSRGHNPKLRALKKLKTLRAHKSHHSEYIIEGTKEAMIEIKP